MQKKNIPKSHKKNISAQNAKTLPESNPIPLLFRFQSLAIPLSVLKNAVFSCPKNWIFSYFPPLKMSFNYQSVQKGKYLPIPFHPALAFPFRQSVICRRFYCIPITYPRCTHSLPWIIVQYMSSTSPVYVQYMFSE